MLCAAQESRDCHRANAVYAERARLLASLEDLSKRPPPKHPRPGRDQDSVLMICKPWHGGVRVNAGRGGGAPGREPYGRAGAAADVDQPVGGRQLRGIGDRTHPRAVSRGHPQRG